MKLLPFVSAILGKIAGVGKCQGKFMVHIIELFLSLKSRYTISNMSRYGTYLESSYHEWFRKAFDYESFNGNLIAENAGKERFIAYDPSFLSKSGKKTPGIGRFWSGCAGAVKKGLELDCIGVVDVENHTGFHYGFTQTLPEDVAKFGLYESHAKVITSRKDELKALAGNIVVADAFFSNKTYNDSLHAEGFILVSRMQKRSKMRYKYLGKPKGGQGRPKTYGGKVDVKNLDLEHFRLFAETTKDEITEKCYEAIIYIDALKVWAKTVVVQNYDAKTGILKSTQIYFATDTAIQGMTVLRYYRLRFQIEFLFRDTKQHLGLNHCQSTNKKVLHFHWNLALTTLNVAKAVHWLPQNKLNKTPFSIADIKTLYFNQLYIDKFSSAFGIDPDNEKNSAIIADLLTWGTFAA